MGEHAKVGQGAAPPEPEPLNSTSDVPPTRFQTYDYPMPEPAEFRTANPYRVQVEAPQAPVVPVKGKSEIGNRVAIGALCLAIGAGSGFISGINLPAADPVDWIQSAPTVTETVTKSPKPAPSSSSSSSSVMQGFGDGTYVVGEDIKAARYTTAEAAGEGCYWEISESGTNGDKIIQNEFSAGGRQVVTLTKGQDFQTEDCGKWVRK